MYLILDIYPYFLNKPTQYVVDYQHPSPVHRWRQLVAIFVCVMFAVGTGTLVGLFLSFIGQENRPTQGSYEFKHFHDNSWWEVADDYGNTLIPYTYTTSVPTADVPCHPTLSSHPLNSPSHPIFSSHPLIPPSQPIFSSHPIKVVPCIPNWLIPSPMPWTATASKNMQ